MMHPMWMAWSGVWWWPLILTLTILAAVALARALLPRPHDPTRPDPALEVLRTRFASGEIDEAEYLRRRAALSPHERGTQP